MEVSKVTFTEETKKAMANPLLPHAKKMQLRKEAIKSYIRSRPVGAQITNKQIFNALGEQNIKLPTLAAFLDGMIKRGELKREKVFRRRKAIYTIPEDAKTITPPIEKLDIETNKAEKQESPTPLLVSTNLSNLAKEFAWQKNKKAQHLY
jgi:hypothetical protein